MVSFAAAGCLQERCHYFFDFDGSAPGGPGALGEDYYPMSPFIGGWVLIAIVAASMSTGDGAILAMSTVFSHNLLAKLPIEYLRSKKNLLTVTRLTTVLWAAAAGGVASGAPDVSGYLLIVAFDIMFAGAVVPMFAAVYWKKCNPLAAVIAMVGGSITRLILEFTLEKDGLLLLVGSYARTFGPGAYLDPYFASAPESCPQKDLEDWSGVDSLISPGVSLFLLLVCQFLPVPDHPLFKAVAPPPEDDDKSTSKRHAGFSEVFRGVTLQKSFLRFFRGKTFRPQMG